MEHYIEINFAPHMPEIALAVTDKLHAKVIKIFHGTIRNLHTSEVGISYPDWSTDGSRPTLGRRVIIFSHNKEILEKVNSLMDFEELEMTGVICRERMSPVPTDAERATFTRSRVGDRSLRLLAAGEGDEQMLKEKIANEKLPFIMIKKPGGSRFSLAIDKRDPVVNTRNFNTYGLSAVASAPIIRR
jgi:CRISPR-associated endoribonuclease Cas6/Csy4 subtype I-F